jgi:hypothetical protein
MKPSAVFLCVLALTGCNLSSGPDCIDETRGLVVSARLGSVAANPLVSDTGSAQINLFEARNASSKATSARELTWFVGSGLNRANVTAVHIHELDTDRLLFTIPLDPATGPPYVIAQVFTRVPYNGALSWTDLYELLGNERAYIDIHTTQVPQGPLRGPLRRDNTNWQTYTHAYCS